MLDKKIKPSARDFFPLGETGKLVLYENNDFIYVWDMGKFSDEKKDNFFYKYGKEKDGLYLHLQVNTGKWFLNPIVGDWKDKEPLFYGECILDGFDKDEKPKKMNLGHRFKITSEGLKSVGEAYVEHVIIWSEDFDKKEPTPVSLLDLDRHGGFHSLF